MALSGAVGSYQEFNYTGGMQSVTIPADGIYKLECYGAQGGKGTANGGYGGYSIGYAKLTKGQTIYICVGGAGKTCSNIDVITNGGYNGGGLCVGNYWGNQGSGGGATHMASVNGTLKSIGVSNKSKVLIVAGGGGGGSGNDDRSGGTGGGTTGGSGGTGTCTGGNQTGGGASQASVSNYINNAGFGYGGALTGIINGYIGSGGGGGWYGGGGHCGLVSEWQSMCGSGGGSGYIGGVPSFSYNDKTYSPSTTNGKRSGNGYAKITFVALSKIYKLNVDGSVVQTVYLDGVALEQIKFDGVSVFGNP